MPGTPNVLRGGRGSDVVLGFDFGLRRIGVATGNLRTRTATPLVTLDVAGDLPWTRLDALLREWRPVRLIVGIPEGSEGTTSVARRAAAFAAALGARYGLPVATVDETLSSAAAAAELKEGRRSGWVARRVRKESVDRHAARLILEQWLAEPKEDEPQP